MEKGGEHQREVRLPTCFQFWFRFNHLPYPASAESAWRDDKGWACSEQARTLMHDLLTPHRSFVFRGRHPDAHPMRMQPEKIDAEEVMPPKVRGDTAERQASTPLPGGKHGAGPLTISRSERLFLCRQCWFCGIHLSTLERNRTRSHRNETRNRPRQSRDPGSLTAASEPRKRGPVHPIIYARRI